jgi:general secretion pathway protein B
VSFILEALKRSENQRQRETGPGLATAPASTEGRRRPPWLAIAAALLVLNLAVLAFMLSRPAAQTGSAPGDSAPTAATAAPAPRPAQTVRPDPTPTGAVAAPVAPPPAPARSMAAAESAPPARVRGEVRSLRAEATATPARAAVAGTPTATSGGAAPPAASVAAPSPTPAPASASTRAPPPAATPNESVSSGLPTVQEVTLRGEFSGRPLHLDLHVYYDDPARRLVFINGTKYREGEEMEDGLRVDEIVPEGVVLDNGRVQFLLPST